MLLVQKAIEILGLFDQPAGHLGGQLDPFAIAVLERASQEPFAVAAVIAVGGVDIVDAVESFHCRNLGMACVQRCRCWRGTTCSKGSRTVPCPRRGQHGRPTEFKAACRRASGRMCVSTLPAAPPSGVGEPWVGTPDRQRWSPDRRPVIPYCHAPRRACARGARRRSGSCPVDRSRRSIVR